jgi:hypothetical protein
MRIQNIKFVLMVLITIKALQLNAQSEFKEFAPIGATWYYDNQQQVSFDGRGYRQYFVEKDSLIETKICKVVSYKEVDHTGREYYNNTYIIHEDNGMVYQLRDNDWQLVYDFKLNKGDTLKIDVQQDAMCDSVTSVLVDSTGILELDGIQLKVQYLSYFIRFFSADEPLEKITYEITEKIGSSSEFMDVPSCFYESSWTERSLRCYNDNEIQFVESWWSNAYPGADCDELINNTAIPTNNDKDLVTVFPNPVIDFLNLNFTGNSSNNYNVELYTIYGKKLFTTKNCTRLDMLQFPSGVYLLRIIVGNDNKVVKIIKK